MGRVMNTNEILKPNILISYKGGGFDGCFWEWNFAFIDKNEEFHDIYSSGYRGCSTIEDLVQYINNEISSDFDTYDMSKAKERNRFADTESINCVIGLNKRMLELKLNIVCKLICDVCGKRFDTNNGGRELGYKGNGGVGIEITSMICQDCVYSNEENKND